MNSTNLIYPHHSNWNLVVQQSSGLAFKSHLTVGVATALVRLHKAKPMFISVEIRIKFFLELTSENSSVLKSRLLVSNQTHTCGMRIDSRFIFTAV